MKIRQHRGDVDFLWSSVENDENNAYYLNCNNGNWNMNNKSNANSNYGFVVLRDFLLFDERKSDMAKKQIEPFSSPVDLSDMYYAYECCRKNKKNKYGTKKFEANALFNVQRLVEDINNKKYKLSQSQCFIVKDPKVREVFCANFRDRVVQHFVFNELNPVIDKLLIFDAANCRVNKGTDFAVSRVERFIRSATKDYKEQAFYLKMDMSGFFMRIQRQGLLNKVDSIIDQYYKGKYKEVLHYLVKIIIFTDVTKNTVRISPKSEWNLLPPGKTLFGNENGQPIGNICSQLFANLYLNELDHLIKSRHRYYSRYVDDMIIVNENRNRLEETLEIIKDFLPEICMELNDKTKIGNVADGIKYLGMDIFPHYSVLGKQRINRLYASDFHSSEEAYKSISSRKGQFTRYHGRHLARLWYNHLPENIKEEVKMNSDCKAVLIKKEGRVECRKNKDCMNNSKE